METSSSLQSKKATSPRRGSSVNEPPASRRNNKAQDAGSHRALYEQLLQENNKAWKEEFDLVQEENERLKRELSEAHARIRQLQLLGRQHQASMRPFRVLDSMLSQSTSESRDDDDSSVEVSLASSVDSGAITVKAGNTNKLRKKAQDNGPTAVSTEQHPLKHSPSGEGGLLRDSSKKKPKQKLKAFALFKGRSKSKRNKEKPETSTAAAIVEESTLQTFFEEESSLDSVQTQCSISSYSTMSDSDVEYSDQRSPTKRYASESMLQQPPVEQQDAEASDDELEAIIARINLEPEELYE